MSRAEYDATLYPVPRMLIEQAISALYEEAANNEHWKGVRDYRIEEPIKAAEALRAIVGPYEPVYSPEEIAAQHEWFAEWMRNHGMKETE